MRITPGYCPRCGTYVGPYMADAADCPRCVNQALPLDGAVCVGEYSGVLADVICKYKYGRQQRMDGILGAMLSDAIRGRPWGGRVDGLVPVPASWLERWGYGFYPVALLANVVGGELGLPVLSVVGIRGKRRRQVELPESERSRNVRGVFYLGVRACVAGRRLCILDDVHTSGATLREVARVLKQAGAAEVYAATVGKTHPGCSDGRRFA
ncbi:MAG: ComF family protein [Phycisphaerales bacterium]|nr:ComF family protein [Phycisphaerales bacterium]